MIRQVTFGFLISMMSSCVTMHACDRETERRTNGQTDRITTPKTALAYARAVKTANVNERDVAIANTAEICFN